METTMQFQQNAKVFTVTGDDVGSLTRVVIHPETKAVTHIVVRKKALLDNEEKLVPIDQILEASEARILLNETAEDVKILPPFEEKRQVRDEAVPRTSSSLTQIGTVYGTMTVPANQDQPGGRYITVVEQNIPSGTVAVKEGAKVISAEGKNVGKVEGILADTPAEQATHLLVSKGKISEEKKLIPFDWVQWIEEKEIHLNVKKDTVKELESVSAEPGSMDNDGSNL